MEQKIKILTLLMVISALGNLVYVNFQEPLLPQLFFLGPILLLSFLVIYFFYHRRNWARILVLIGAVLGILSFLAIFTAPGLFHAVFYLYDGVLSVYLLICLNQTEVRAFFKRSQTVGATQKPQKGRLGRVLLILGLILMTIIGAAALGIRSFIQRAENSQIWIEYLESGEAIQITQSGMNSHPKFSSIGDRIAFISRSDPEGKQGSTLNTYSLNDQSITIVFEDTDLMTSPSWGPGDKSLVFSRRLEGQTDLWRYFLEEKELKRITNDDSREQNPLVSRNGQWILFEQKDADDANIFYLLPLAGGEKRPLTEKTDFLHESKLPAWSPDSSKIAYVSFIDLVIQDIQTDAKEIISLAGLNNMMSVLFYPTEPNRIIVKARPAESISFSFNLYKVSRINHQIEVWKSDRRMVERDHDISPDGKKLVYVRS